MIDKIKQLYKDNYTLFWLIVVGIISIIVVTYLTNIGILPKSHPNCPNCSQADMLDGALGFFVPLGFFLFIIWLFGNKLGIWKWLSNVNWKKAFRR